MSEQVEIPSNLLEQWRLLNEKRRKVEHSLIGKNNHRIVAWDIKTYDNDNLCIVLWREHLFNSEKTRFKRYIISIGYGKVPNIEVFYINAIYYQDAKTQREAKRKILEIYNEIVKAMDNIDKKIPYI